MTSATNRARWTNFGMTRALLKMADILSLKRVNVRLISRYDILTGITIKQNMDRSGACLLGRSMETQTQALRPSGRRGRPSAADIRLRMADLLQVARTEFVRRGYRKTTMADIAVAAGLTKRTLYLWHENKAALFLCCIREGAARFPRITPDENGKLDKLLGRYLDALIIEFAREDANAMGRLFLREGTEFPELAPIIDQSYTDYIVDPLADFLRKRGIEKAGSVATTELLLSMALAPFHNHLLLGRALPDTEALRAHGKFVTKFFIAGTRDGSS